MVALLFFLLRLLVSPFRPIGRLEAENAALRRQLIVLQRQVRGRVQFTNSDRLFFLQLYRWFPSIVKAMTTIRPETLVRWHRAGFRRYWRWKSRNLGGRPPIDAGLRALIRRMSIENMLWGAPRIQVVGPRGFEPPTRPLYPDVGGAHASHRLPIIARYFLERRTIGIGLRHVRRLRPRSGTDFVE